MWVNYVKNVLAVGMCCGLSNCVWRLRTVASIVYFREIFVRFVLVIVCSATALITGEKFIIKWRHVWLWLLVVWCMAVNGEDGEYITVIFDTPEEAQQ